MFSDGMDLDWDNVIAKSSQGNSVRTNLAEKVLGLRDLPTKPFKEMDADDLYDWYEHVMKLREVRENYK